ncbi:hypothetical protein CIPAW_02G017600 [Carya illinoinensis]|uniref:Uncharacterized protein n=1 Tax=Carya illinoinensis TaxID=32201 RepID=A0A8T1R9N4_CARIL|nr:hypothetical protein CIPAW_02G017600 [Carya illinoinensis]KAG6663315.1 hypothetical protein CIPAW_02G017600 [Carya illinoinensis]
MGRCLFEWKHSKLFAIAFLTMVPQWKGPSSLIVKMCKAMFPGRRVAQLAQQYTLKLLGCFHRFSFLN